MRAMSTAAAVAGLPDNQWRPRLRELVAELTAETALRTPGWQAAFAAVPRHPFVPLIYRRDQFGDLRAVDGHDPAQRETWLTEVYSDDSLITQLAQVRPGYALRPFTVPASSSTRPSLMARMLEDLELADGMRVLEVGTGTGYNAALLSHRLGAQHVHSVDIHPGLIATARSRLADLGYHPQLATVDGTAGWPEHAPYDRIIATCSVPTIPIAWVDQVRPGGAILSDLQLGGASALVRLHVDADRSAIGRFLSYPGLFMAARRSADQLSRLPELTPDQLFGVRETTTDLVPTALADPAFRFFLHLYLGTGRSDHYRSGDRDCASVVADDGSWAELTTGEHLVRYDGTHNPWETVEQAYHRWNDLKRPGPADLGLTVTPTTQHIWHRTPHSTWTHPLTSTSPSWCPRPAPRATAYTGAQRAASPQLPWGLV
jgi:methyltransferase of ATP-grasp peptide maturase system